MNEYQYHQHQPVQLVLTGIHSVQRHQHHHRLHHLPRIQEHVHQFHQDYLELRVLAMEMVLLQEMMIHLVCSDYQQ